MAGLQMLKISLKTLANDSQFVRQSEKMGIYNLEDVMRCSLDELKSHKDFTFTWYANVLGLLKEHGLLRLFQEKHI